MNATIHNNHFATTPANKPKQSETHPTPIISITEPEVKEVTYQMITDTQNSHDDFDDDVFRVLCLELGIDDGKTVEGVESWVNVVKIDRKLYYFFIIHSSIYYHPSTKVYIIVPLTCY